MCAVPHCRERPLTGKASGVVLPAQAWEAGWGAKRGYGVLGMYIGESVN